VVLSWSALANGFDNPIRARYAGNIAWAILPLMVALKRGILQV
jgi:hypothetical protein